MKHVAEDDLIAYQMKESAEVAAIAQHLELCPECARAAESIAETLSVFSAEPVPQANLDHAWQRLRGSLPVLSPAPRRRGMRSRLAIPVVAGALLIALVAAHHRTAVHSTGSIANLAPGPLTEQPRDPELAAHLESAERLLTEVSHSAGSLDQTTLDQAHDLLLSNALYVRKADADGDVADAAVLDKLDRTLTTLEHEPARERTGKGWNLSVRMNSEGLLLDLRILQQNASTKESR